MNNILLSLNKLCGQIEREWQRVDNDVNLFAAIVMKVTEGFDLSPFGELSNIVSLLNENPYLSRLQKITSFSDLYIMLWQNGQFHVEVLNWWGTDINIHDHNFSGVQFQLTGSSLNVVYDFNNKCRSTRVHAGDIFVRYAELWVPGSRSVVRPGGVDPHTVHHLSMPTVSLLIRTAPVNDFGPQLNYFPPGIAGSYSVSDTLNRVKRSALKLLARENKVEFDALFREVITSQSLTENLFLLMKMTDVLFQSKHVHLLYDFAEKGELERKVVEALSYRAGVEFLLEKVKKIPSLSPDEILAVSALAGAFNASGLRKILSDLDAVGYRIDLQSFVDSVASKLSVSQRKELSKVLDLFEYHDYLPNEEKVAIC